MNLPKLEKMTLNTNHIKLALGVDVVSVQTVLDFYPRNLLAEIFQFRAKQLVALNWRGGSISYTTLPNSSEISETDSQDTPGTIYFSKSDCNGNIVGIVRLSPNVDIFGKNISMLGTNMSHIIDVDNLPKASNIYEASRLVLNKELLNSKKLREPIINELIIATVRFAIESGIKEFFGFMDNEIWKSTYERLGFDLTKIGHDTEIQDIDYPKYTVSARLIRFNEEIIRMAKADSCLLNFGNYPAYETLI